MKDGAAVLGALAAEMTPRRGQEVPSPSAVPPCAKQCTARARQSHTLCFHSGGSLEPYFSRFGISASRWGVLRTLQRSEDQVGPRWVRPI